MLKWNGNQENAIFAKGTKILRDTSKQNTTPTEFHLSFGVDADGAEAPDALKENWSSQEIAFPPWKFVVF